MLSHQLLNWDLLVLPAVNDPYRTVLVLEEIITICSSARLRKVQTSTEYLKKILKVLKSESEKLSKTLKLENENM